MLAVLVNTLAVLLGSTVGLLARKGIPEKVSGAIMTAISLCTLYAASAVCSRAKIRWC